MKTVLAIDPGPENSAFVLWNGERVLDSGILPNDEMIARLHGAAPFVADVRVLIEKVESFGMAVGAEVFETVYWSGRFAQYWIQRGGGVDRIGRKAIKMHHCHSMRAKDANIRAALLDKYPAGKKASPGPSYGIKSHLWAALALATYWTEKEVSSETDDVLFPPRQGVRVTAVVRQAELPPLSDEDIENALDY